MRKVISFVLCILFAAGLAGCHLISDPAVLFGSWAEPSERAAGSFFGDPGETEPALGTTPSGNGGSIIGTMPSTEGSGKPGATTPPTSPDPGPGEPEPTDPPAADPAPEHFLTRILGYEGNSRVYELTCAVDAQGRIQRLKIQLHDVSGKERDTVIRTFDYNAQGLLTRCTQEHSFYGTFVSEYSYDSKGNLLTAKINDSEGWSTLKNTYDSQGRLIRSAEEFQPGTDTTDYVYNSQGILTEKKTVCLNNGCTYNIRTTLEYNSRQQLIRETSVNGQQTTVITYRYDSRGRLVEEKEEYPNGFTQDLYDYTCPGIPVKTQYTDSSPRAFLYLNLYGWWQHFGTAELTFDTDGYIVSAYNPNLGTRYEFYYDDAAPGTDPTPEDPTPVDPSKPTEGPEPSHEYTADEIAALVENYYNTHYQNEDYPGTYVVFRGEISVYADKYVLFVRFQADYGDINTPANVLVADVTYYRQTGVAIASDYTGDHEIDIFG